MHRANQTDNALKSLHLIVNEWFINRNLPDSGPYNSINTTTHVNTSNVGGGGGLEFY
jgi:hypothetical protein